MFHFTSMNFYHIDNPDSYYECYEEEVAHVTKLMVALDRALIHSNLPPVCKTKELFDMVHDMSYVVQKRYMNKQGLEEDDGFNYFNKNDLLDSMKTLLQEEVTRYFDQISGMSK